MVILFHHPFCPHSRFVRIVLGEYGATARLVEEWAWERREGFLALNPDGTTPVLVEDGHPAVARCAHHRGVPRRGVRPDAGGAAPVVGRAVRSCRGQAPCQLVQRSLLRRSLRPAGHRAGLQVHHDPRAGGGPPDSNAIRAARHNIGYHLAYMEWLLRRRDCLAGDRLSYADMAAAAHLSIADYLGEVAWNEDEAAKNWYARIKSRPSFRPILADLHPGVPPAPSYADLDF